jgi:hypothetical protein
MVTADQGSEKPITDPGHLGQDRNYSEPLVISRLALDLDGISFLGRDSVVQRLTDDHCVNATP